MTSGLSEMSGLSGVRNYQRLSPEEADTSRIPVSFRRSRSMRLRGERNYGGAAPPPAPTPAPFPRISESRESSAPSSSRGISPPLPRPSARLRSLSLSLTQPNGTVPKAARTPVKSPAHSKHFSCKYGQSPGHCTSPATPPVSPEDITGAHLEDDMDSLHSYSSVATTASCDHAYVARNGTTFSGRKMKYVVHCSAHAGQTGEEYLTPTQRAQRQIRRLKTLLNQAKFDLDKKDSDIFRLTKEVVELRLYKASLTSPDEKSNSSDAVTVKEITGDDIQTPDSPNLQDLTDDGPIKSHSEYSKDSVDFRGNHLPSYSLNLSDLQSSLADSGHFEDLTTSSVHSKDSMGVSTQDKACGVDLVDKEDDRLKLINLYEKKIEDMTRKQTSDTQDIKKLHNDRVEAILQKLADVNTRYSEMMPNYEEAKERIRDLEKELEQVSKQLSEQEEKHHKMYLQMYTKGQESARYDQINNQDPELTHACSRVSVPELLEELQVTQRELDNIRDLSYSPERTSTKSRILLSAKEAVSLWVLGARKAMYKRIMEAQAGSRKAVDPEVTLQFLKSAIYYFLTDRENHQGHLNAIESILGFTDAEKENIQRARIN